MAQVRNSRPRALGLGAAALLIGGLTAAMADVPEIVDWANGPHNIDGFKLVGSGALWWRTGVSPNEETAGVEGLLSVRRTLAGVNFNRYSSRPYYAIQSTELSAPPGAVERVGDQLFYFSRIHPPFPRLYRRSIHATSHADAIDFTGVSFNQSSAMVGWGGRLYFSVIVGNDLQLRSKSVDGGPGGGDIIEFTLRNSYPAKKIVIIDEVIEDGRQFATRLAILTTDGLLYLYEIQGQRAGEPPQLLYVNVSDVAVRNESVRNIGEDRVYGTMIYMTTGLNTSASRVSGKLVVHNLTAGPSSTFVMYDTGSRDSQLVSVAVDPDRIFLTRRPLLPAGDIGVPQRFNSTLMRRDYRADRLRPFDELTGFGDLAIEPIGAPREALQLTSDRQWLYWINSNEIRKVKTDTPFYDLDCMALRLEAVQAVQDMNNSVPLVAGKPTMVRGYARFRANSLNLTGLKPKAILRGFRNGVLLGETPNDNRPLIDAHEAPIIVRSEFQRSFHFDVPADWMRGGNLRLEMTVNPTLSVPETGGAPLANNTVAHEFEVINVVNPSLNFVTMDSNSPDYTMADPGFWPILSRALTLLPVPDFNVRCYPGVLSKPVPRIVLPPRLAPFTMPDDKNWAMIWLTLAHAFSHRPAPGSDPHWIGMFPPGDRPWNGIGGIRNVSLADLIGDPPFNLSIPNTPLAYTSCVRMEMGQGNNSAVWNSLMGGHTLAHELGHNYGRFHIDQTRSLGCGISKPDRPWHIFPGDPCTLGPTVLSDPAAPIGYDPLNYAQVPPHAAGDLMSYANSSWISPFTWNAILNVLPKLPNLAPGISPAADEPGIALAGADSLVFVQGVLRPRERTAALFPAFSLPPGVMEPALVQQLMQATDRLPANSPYRLRLLGTPGGPPLAERPILFLPATEGDDREIAFLQPLPSVPGVTRLQVVQEGSILAELARSASSPEVTLDPPVIDLAAESLALRWAALDQDGDLLLFTVQFTPDNGATWDTLTVNDPTLGLAVGTKLLRGGTTCRLRVIATDGLNTTVVSSTPFSLPKHTPVISHTGIREQQRVPFGSNVTVQFYGYDAEDGSIPSSQLSWSITGREARSGVTGTVPLAHLPPGNYTLSMSAADSEGGRNSQAVAFQILPLSVPESVPAVIDGLDNDPGYESAASIRLTRGAVEPEVRMFHANGALHLFASGLRASDPNAPPATLQLRFDANSSGGSLPQPGDLAFIVEESGLVTQLRGVVNDFASQPTPDRGVQTEILRTEANWNLELIIPDSLLGGWNHSARLLLWSQRWAWVTPPGVAVPENPLFWPSSGQPNSPSTWAEMSLGPVPEQPNRPPTAVASGPTVVTLAGGIERPTVTLQGGASHDPDGDSLSYTWVQTAGPSVTLATPNAATTAFTAPPVIMPTSLRFQLLVNDGSQNSAPAALSVTVIPLSSQPASGRDVVVDRADGTATVALPWDGLPGDRISIQASTDLIHWLNLVTNSVGFPPSILYTDAQAGVYPHRFYRAASVPSAPPPPRAELRFDGVDDFVEIPHSAILNTFPITITAWFNTTQAESSFPGIVTTYHGDTVQGFAIALDRGRLSCWYYVDGNRRLWDGGAVANTPFVADGRWHHVAYSVDASGGRVYLDGSLVSAPTWVGAPGPTTTTAPLRLGMYPGSGGMHFQGNVDEVTLWNRALTADEVNRLIPGMVTGGEPGLLGSWNLNEGAGLIAADASPNQRHGSLRNGPQWSDSTAPLQPNPAAGTALRFDGVDDLVTVPHQASLNTFPLTVAAWVKTAQISPGYVAVANKYPGGAGNGYSLHIHNGRLAAFYFRENGAGSIYPGDPGLDGGFIADGQWHHVAFVVDASGGRIYIDGLQTAALGWTGLPGPCSITAPLLFGTYPLGGQVLSLDGRIDEITLWSRALNVTEINQWMQTKLQGTESGLIGYWPFDNGAGTTASDATGHGLNGILEFGPLWLPSEVPVYP